MSKQVTPEAFRAQVEKLTITPPVLPQRITTREAAAHLGIKESAFLRPRKGLGIEPAGFRGAPAEKHYLWAREVVERLVGSPDVAAIIARAAGRKPKGK